MALAALISFEKMWRAPAVNVAGVTQSSRATNHIGRTDGRPFPLPSVARVALLLLSHIRMCDVARQTAMKCDLVHCDRISLARCTNRVPDCGTRADRSTTVRTLGECSGCKPCVGGRPSAGLLLARAENNGESAQLNDLVMPTVFPCAPLPSIIRASVATYACVFVRQRTARHQMLLIA
jgi:hypothetical protein